MKSSQSNRFVERVSQFANAVEDHGQDRYGDRRTPLFVDAIDVETNEPATGRKAGETWSTGAREPTRPDAAASNLAHQQNLLRTLVTLSELTGRDRYRERAAEAVRFTFDELTDGQGLLYWGGHAAYDLRTDEPIFPTDKALVHELKYHYPYYEFLWEVDPEGTRRFIEALWNANVIDWSNLDFNRHGGYDAKMGSLWDHEYEGGDVFFMGEGRTFVNSGSDLYVAAGMLAHLADEDEPLEWGKRLAERYVQTRQEPGISGYVFSSRQEDERDKVTTADRAHYQLDPYIHGDHLIREGTLFQPKPRVQRQQLRLGERLGERGSEFTRWALEELRAWGEVAYRPDENEFEPMLTDGYSLDGFLIQREGYYKSRGHVVRPIEGHPDFLWAYAQAYRISEEDFHWRMARDLALGIGLGDIGSPDSVDPSLTVDTDHADYNSIYGLLELYRATDADAYLELATRIGENVVADRFDEESGLFVSRRDNRVALVGAHEPLALLHVAAAVRDEPRPPYPGLTAYGAGTSASGGI